MSTTLLRLLPLSALLAAPQASSRAAAPAPVAELPMELVGGHIYVPASVGDRRTTAILDTGAAATIMDLRLADEWALPSSGEVDARGTGSRAVKGKMLRDAAIEVGGVSHPVGFAIPLAALDEAEGRRMETILGWDFFRTRVVELDYPNGRVRVFSGDAAPETAGVSVRIRVAGGLPTIQVSMKVGGADSTLESMVDTGAMLSGVTAKYAKEHPIDAPSTPATRMLGGVGGFVDARLFRPDSVSIGALAFSRPVLFQVESGGGVLGERATRDMVVGSDLLRRCRVVFDGPRSRMTLEPAKDFARPFEAEKTGMRLFAQGRELREYRVVGVMPGSSAERAGILEGDVLETVDGAPASQWTLQQLRERFRSAAVESWELGFRRGAERRRVTVPAKSVL